MKENIKKETNLENFKLLILDCKEHRKLYNESFVSEDDIEIMDNILFDYKRVLKENEELKSDNYELNNIINDLLDSIPKQKVKDEIEYINKFEEDLYKKENIIQVLQDLLEEKGE